MIGPCTPILLDSANYLFSQTLYVDLFLFEKLSYVYPMTYVSPSPPHYTFFFFLGANK
jgi:hypothetical protein